MPQPFSLLRRAALAAVATLSLAACHRAEYAVLPKSPAYLGSASAHYAPRPQAMPAAAEVAPAAEVPAVAGLAASRPVAAEKAAAPSPSAVVGTAAPAAVPVAAVPVVQAACAPVVSPEPARAEVASAQPKLKLGQRLLMSKVLRKVDKQTQKLLTRQGDNTAGTARIDSKLRYAIIFGAIGIIFYVIGGSFFNTLGTIAIIIAILFLLFWLLDNL